MKPTTYLINTSHSSLIDKNSINRRTKKNRIAGAALGVYGTQPLSDDHPFRSMDNVLAIPHIGYVTEDTYRAFYGNTLNAILEWLAKVQ